MKSPVAKIRVEDLLNSSFQMAKNMVGNRRSGWKYLSQAQVDQVTRYGLVTVPLSEQDLVNIKKSRHKKSKVEVAKIPTKVTFKDEDGEMDVQFESQQDALNWIQFQESKVSSGEKFELISIEPINKLTK